MNDQIINIIFYGFSAIIFIAVIAIYLSGKRSQTRITGEKIKKAVSDGLHEPVSLHPHIDPGRCIGVGACVKACPEGEILGMKNGRAVVINAARCIGHGACVKSCPTEAVSLRIGTEKRGVDIPEVDRNFETRVPGIFIAGELGGMGLIRNAAEQGKQAVDNIARSVRKDHVAQYDLVIAGAGPAGISAALAARKHNLRFILLEQDTLGGTVSTYPRNKIVLTSPVNLPLAGRIKLTQTSKKVLIDLWQDIIRTYDLPLNENCKVETISRSEGAFNITTSSGLQLSSAFVLLATGRRGTPRKLNVPGEEKEKVAYRLLEPEDIREKNILVVGGGDSAVESALLLCDANNVALSYRGDNFSRIKPMNNTAVRSAIDRGKIKVYFSSNVKRIDDDLVCLTTTDGEMNLPNDLVFIFAGGELPSQFLVKCGISVRTMKGETISGH
jgi:thioredoxin reductase (NADPH)